MPGPTELCIIAFIIVVLFGAKRVPELMKGTGEALRSFRQGAKEIEAEVEKVNKEL